MKKLFLSMILMALPILASAYDAEVDGIYYNLFPERKEAEVTCQKCDDYLGIYYSNYSGEIIIPEKFTYEGVEYSVTTIGERAFYGCSGLNFITIPNSVTTIGWGAFRDCI